MTRLPIPGQDEGQWGNILNDYLSAAHNTDGTLKPNSITTATLAPGSVTTTALSQEVQDKLDTIAGQQGATGPVGPTGPTGPTGPSGTPGSIGATGAQGPSGAQGASGPSGAIGSPGATGPSGASGAQGAAGPTGPSGAQGNTGLTGATGPTGASGAQGTPGATGASGAVGATGPAGATTIAGISGLQAALDGKAASSHVHAAGDITSGTFTPATATTGTPIYVFYNGTNWTDAANNTIIARPTSRTDIPIVLVDTTADGTAAIPGWALQRDFVLQSTGATGNGGGSGTAIFQWYGTGIANGHTIIASDAGTGDLAISTVEGSTAPTINTGSSITPAVSFAQAAGQICTLNWTSVGTHTGSRARFFFQTPVSWYASTQALARFTNSGATIQYLGVSLRGSGTPGTLSLNDTTNNNVLSTPTNTLALSTWYRVEFAVDQTAGTGYLGIWDTSGNHVYDSGPTSLSVGSGGWTRFRWGPMVSGVTTSLLMAKLKVIEETNIAIGAN